MATGSASELKNRYRNVTSGWLGVILKDAKGDLHGVSVPAGEEVWMDEAERVATAGAPRLPESNPFANGALVKTAEAGEAKTNRQIDAPLAPDARPAEPTPPPSGGGMPREERAPDPRTPTPAASAPGEEATDTPLPATSAPPTGTRAPGEEVGSPGAEQAAADSAKGAFREKDDGSKPVEAAPPPPPAPGSEPSVSTAPPGGTQEATRRPVATQGQGGR